MAAGCDGYDWNGRHVSDGGSFSAWGLNMFSNIGGSTLHSWAGVGLGKLPVEVLIKNIRKDKTTSGRWRETGALIVDEGRSSLYCLSGDRKRLSLITAVSMMDGAFLDKLEQIGRAIRDDPRPFGGLQVILSGDFYQLPPVGDENPLTGRKEYTFAFDSKCWPALIPEANMLALTQVYRQRDHAFVKILEGMRKGYVSPEGMEKLQQLDRKVVYDDGIEPVEL
jgi:ATP-dependent DNA helicase PIF1